MPIYVWKAKDQFGNSVTREINQPTVEESKAELVAEGCSEAKQELEASLAVLAANPNQPYRDGSISIARAYLCLVLDRLGDHEGAQKNFAAARDYLMATGEADLIEECKRFARVE